METTDDKYRFNKQYLSSRLGWLWKISDSMENKKYRCSFLEKLNRINSRDEVNKGILSTTYPVSITVMGENGRKYGIPLYVKETRAGYEQSVPYTIINEIKIMRGLVYEMFSKYRSPHFVFPIYQLMVDSGDQMDDTKEIFENIVLDGKINPQYRLCSSKETTSEEKLAIYNFMEYLHPNVYSPLLKFIDRPDIGPLDLQGALFQIFYNLAVMEKLQFRHGDLHPGNIMVARSTEIPWKALYVIDKDHHYLLDTPVFTAMIDFDRSFVYSEYEHGIDIPDEPLHQSPCIPTGGMSPGKKQEVLNDCWRIWNPYSDLTRFIIGLWFLWRFESSILETMFPDERLRADVLVLLGEYTKNLYGYPSLKELEERVPRAVLDRMTPSNLFIRYAEQLRETRMVTLIPRENVPNYKRYNGLIFFVN